MIPRHSLPFGIGKLFSILVASSPKANPSDVERSYADELGVREVVLIPSVRAGILIVLKAISEPGLIAAGPAYTCHTVHEAMARSGWRMRLIDSAKGSFLMRPEDISAACEPGCALVLSEIYGIPYDREMLHIASKKGPGVRILDMAMCIPSPGRLGQLEAEDVALFSFGWGKPMYAGWGGAACFQDTELSGRVREMLALSSSPETPVLEFRHACAASLRTVMNQRTLYGISHEPHIYRMFRRAASTRGDRFCRTDRLGGRLPHQWTHPMTALNRKLSLYNLSHSAQNAGMRRDQAEVYSRSLVESGIVRGPGGNALPQSHFPIRIPSVVRDKICDYLRGRGIDTSTLFQFPSDLSRDLYPEAAQASAEVITLPLGPAVTIDEVRMISGCVKDGLLTLGF